MGTWHVACGKQRHNMLMYFCLLRLHTHVSQRSSLPSSLWLIRRPPGGAVVRSLLAKGQLSSQWPHLRYSKPIFRAFYPSPTLHFLTMVQPVDRYSHWIRTRTQRTIISRCKWTFSERVQPEIDPAGPNKDLRPIWFLKIPVLSRLIYEISTLGVWAVINNYSQRCFWFTDSSNWPQLRCK